jgi:TPP-dependent pyruvate/acetoin dehydrogenase alpha subunit
MSHPLTREQKLELYYFMQLNRQTEERMTRLFRQNKIVGGLYSSLGQEAVSVGTAYALEKRDWLAPMIRNIGALLVKGVPPRDIFTQHMAKYTSPTKGKDGTSHFGDLKVLHIVSPISMLGDLIPAMTGVAMAGRYLGQNIVSMTWIGDGGSSTGAFHEGLGLAAAQKAPFVLIIENNQWAYSTPVSRQVPVKNLASRAVAYGIESAIVDGNDVMAVYEAAKEAVNECRAGRGPRVIEVKTMRMKGHAQHDPAEYVPPEMFEHWKARDPIALYEKYLTENKIWDAKTKQEIDARIESELNVEQQFAEDSPMPPPELAEEGVYCEGCHTIEADWQRPKEEVMPPKSSINTDWNLAGLGGFGDKVEGSRQTAGQANAQPTSHATSTAHVQTPRGQQPGGRSQNFNSGGNGAKQQKHGSKHGGKPVAKAQPRQQHPRQQPPAQRQPQYAPQPEPEPTDGPRIPFGRGPKGKLGRG